MTKTVYVPGSRFLNPPIVNGSNNTRFGLGDKGKKSGGDCEESERTVEIKLLVKPDYDARCEVRSVNGITTSVGGNPTGNPVYLTPGQEFKAVFAVRNAGSQAWNLVRTDPDQRLFRLGSQDPQDNTNWGTNRLTITGPPDEFGGAALAPGSLTPSFEHQFKVPNDVGAGDTRNFVWQVVHDGGNHPASQGWIGDSCEASIQIRANSPFLRVGGGDVVAGARFTGYKQNPEDATPQSYTSVNAANAGIDTNGENKSFGSSSSQYAASASGFINSITSGQNAFYSNNFNEQGDSERKDLTFANTNVAGDEYGKFYGDGPPAGALPPVDVSALYDLAIKGNSANINSALNSSDSTTVSENSTANTTNISGSKVVMVKGDLTIKNNIEYASGDANLIVLVIGNIYIEKAVTQLDGTYIAYPVDDNTGVVDTCSDFGTAGEWPQAGSGGLTTSQCSSPVTISGRLVASKVVWKRAFGSIGNEDTVIDPACAYQDQSGPEYTRCAAELIDFDPRVYFNSPLQPTEEGSVGNVPTSTLDLPPVY